MDAPRFDDLARSLAAAPSRRGFLRGALAAAGLLGTSAIPGDAARKCRNDGDCGACERCDKRTRRCQGCGKGKRCCGGACVDPAQCCAGPADCTACAACVDGRCRPDVSKNGEPCNGCLVCANGTCGIPDDEQCADGERCRANTGACCPECVEGRCCGAGKVCVNPGLLSDNFCCDARENIPCGDNGDGTFAQCCNRRTEVCDGGECTPKDECAGGRLTAQGVCCATPARFCRNRIGEEECCADGKECCWDADGQAGNCCATGRCLGPGLCCAEGAEVFCSGEFAHCAFTSPERECCGEYSCPVSYQCTC